MIATTRHRLVLLALGLALGSVHAFDADAKTPRATAEPEPVVLFDFEDRKLSLDWRVVNGRMEATRAEIPEPSDDGPSGNGVRASTEKSATLISHHGVVQGDWSAFEALRFWVYRSSESVEQVPVATLRVNAWEVDGHAAFVRRVDLDREGWTEVTLPLRWFRWEGGRVPRWDCIDALAFAFATPGEYWLDEISLIPAAGEGGGQLHPSPAELAELAEGFGAEVHVVERDGVAVISAAGQLDPEQLVAHLVEVRAAVLADLPFLEAPDRPIPLVVLPDEASFHAYVDLLAEAHAAEARVPGLPGYALMGVATSFWDSEFGTLRPVYTHEFVHALMSAAAGLPNLTEWFQEGVAARYQWRFHPDAMDEGYIHRHMEAPEGHKVLPTLCHGTPITDDDYWQAMTVVDLLFEHPRYAPHVDLLLQGFRDAGSTDLRPHVGTVLGVTWDDLERDWRGSRD